MAGLPTAAMLQGDHHHTKKYESRPAAHAGRYQNQLCVG